MRAKRSLHLASLLVAVGSCAAHAGTVDGRPWPPDPTLYEPAGAEVAPGLRVGDVLGSTPTR